MVCPTRLDQPMHIGSTLIRFILLRIPVAMHNVPRTKSSGQHLEPVWCLEPQAADYRLHTFGRFTAEEFYRTPLTREQMLFQHRRTRCSVLAPPQEMFGGGGNRNIVTLDLTKAT